MGEWFPVGTPEDLPPGEGRTRTAGDRRVAVFRDRGDFFAVDDACPHQGASLGSGLLHDGRVICPLHSWVFDLRTGRCPGESHEPVQTYPARLREGAVEVFIE